jgi:hypothetical protein
MAIAVTGMEAVPVSNLTFLPPIPEWEVKTCHYTHHTVHYFASDHPRGRIRQGPYPMIPETRPYPLTLDPSLTRPRSDLDPPPVNKEERPTWHRAQSLFTVSSSTSPWCPGMADHSQDTSLQPPLQGSIKLHLKAIPDVPASSYPIKGQAGALQGGGRRKNNKEQQTMKNQSPFHHRRSTSQATSFVISLLL